MITGHKCDNSHVVEFYVVLSFPLSNRGPTLIRQNNLKTKIHFIQRPIFINFEKRRTYNPLLDREGWLRCREGYREDYIVEVLYTVHF